MLVALIGPDRFLVGQALHHYIEKFAPEDAGLGGLNLTRLDGARITPDELARMVQAMGFLADTRVVVVEGLLSRFAGSKSSDGDDEKGEKADAPVKGRGKADPGLTEGFAQVFGLVPDSTVLILVERGAVAKNSALSKAASRYGKVEEYTPPKGVALERWIADRAKGLKVRITPGAQAMLASGLSDLQALDNELEKLSLYVGTGGTVDETVLRAMSYVSKADDVFEMTSAAARRDTKGALTQLQRLVDGGTAPEGILPVLAWQVRTLIQVRDMLDQRVSEGRMAEKSGLSDFVVRKSIGQARQFTMAKLLNIHHLLLELDRGVKTGRADAEMSLDALVVEMCR
ncbi:MAG: DNA polymerase III subunit delta [Chloroflexota bacterium]